MASGDRTSGRRLYATRTDENGTKWYPIPQPGDYWRDENTNTWHCMSPGAPERYWGSLSLHQVQEHEDGTITVSPSILEEAPGVYSWHGYLERGIWREV